MYCAECNKPLAENVKFCKYCGGPAVAGTPPPPALPPKKKRSSAPLIVVLLILLIFAVGAVGLVYNDNYKDVLIAVGLGQYVEPETTVSETEPTAIAFEQTTELPVVTMVEHTVDEIEPQTSATPTAATTNDSGLVTISPTRYRVDTRSPIDNTPLRIRSGPSVDFEKIGTISNLEVVIVTQLMGDWAYVTYEGISGWAFLDFLVRIG